MWVTCLIYVSNLHELIDLPELHDTCINCILVSDLLDYLTSVLTVNQTYSSYMGHLSKLYIYLDFSELHKKPVWSVYQTYLSYLGI